MLEDPYFPIWQEKARQMTLLGFRVSETPINRPSVDAKWGFEVGKLLGNGTTATAKLDERFADELIAGKSFEQVIEDQERFLKTIAPSRSQ